MRMEGQRKGLSRPRTLFTDVREQFHTTRIRYIWQSQLSKWSNLDATVRRDTAALSVSSPVEARKLANPFKDGCNITAVGHEFGS